MEIFRVEQEHGISLLDLRFPGHGIGFARNDEISQSAMDQRRQGEPSRVSPLFGYCKNHLRSTIRFSHGRKSDLECPPDRKQNSLKAIAIKRPNPEVL
jgi:hypothetical protein